MILETSKPYGYFGSCEEVTKEIQRRIKSGEPTVGSGIIFPGAVIIKGIDGSISMVHGEKEPPMLEFKVYPPDTIVIESDQPFESFGPWDTKD